MKKGFFVLFLDTGIDKGGLIWGASVVYTCGSGAFEAAMHMWGTGEREAIGLD